jgi:hypothetical protein
MVISAQRQIGQTKHNFFHRKAFVKSAPVQGPRAIGLANAEDLDVRAYC